MLSKSPRGEADPVGPGVNSQVAATKDHDSAETHWHDQKGKLIVL